jgi:hypothetical protein
MPSYELESDLLTEPASVSDISKVILGIKLSYDYFGQEPKRV